MKLAIVTATYQRDDKKTPDLLSATLRSVVNQTHKNFKMFIIGDKYLDNNEFNFLIKEFSSYIDIYSKNLEEAVERTKYKNDVRKLWHTGGVTAYNTGVEQALAEGYTYICHLDHDDIWKEHHLSCINHAIATTKADFICTKSTHCGKHHKILPVINKNNSNLLIKFIPAPEQLIHSATCYNYKTIPLRLRDSGGLPADYDLWRRMHPFICQNKLISYCVNELTCFHDQERILEKNKHKIK